MEEHKYIDYSNDYTIAYDPYNTMLFELNERDTDTEIPIYFTSPKDTVINLNFVPSTPYLLLHSVDDDSIWIRLKGKFTDNNKAVFSFPDSFWDKYHERMLHTHQELFVVHIMLMYKGKQMFFPLETTPELSIESTYEGTRLAKEAI